MFKIWTFHVFDSWQLMLFLGLQLTYDALAKSNNSEPNNENKKGKGKIENGGDTLFFVGPLVPLVDIIDNEISDLIEREHLQILMAVVSPFEIKIELAKTHL